MNARDIRRYEMLVRVRDFGTAQASQFAPETLGGQAFTTVASAVAALNQHLAAELSGRSSVARTSKAVAREALLEDLDAISRTARAVELDLPAIHEKFRLPTARTEQSLLATARLFARDAAPLAKQFIDHELPADFLEDLDRDIKELDDAVRDQDAGVDAGAAARAAFETAMDTALAAVQRLDAIVVNRLRNDPATVAVWRRARHVEYASRLKSEAPQPAAAGGAAAEPAAT